VRDRSQMLLQLRWTQRELAHFQKTPMPVVYSELKLQVFLDPILLVNAVLQRGRECLQRAVCYPNHKNTV